MLGDTRSQESVTKLSLASLFIAAFAAFVSRERPTGKHVEVKPFEFLLLALATFRLGRMTAFDKVAEPLREPFTVTTEDSYGAAETVEPRGRGWRRVVGELLACPVCTGTWIAAGLVYGLHLLPGPTRVFTTIMATIGATELLQALQEAHGPHARQRGSWPTRRRPSYRTFQ